MKIFHGGDLYEYLKQCNDKLEQEVIKEEKNRLLNTDEVAYIDYLVNKYIIEPLDFKWAEGGIKENEQAAVSTSNLSRDFMPFGHRVPLKPLGTYHLPFSGSHVLLQMTPSNRILWTMDIAINAKQDEISFEIINQEDNSEKIKAGLKRDLDNIKQQSSYSTDQVNQYNNTLKKRAEDAVSRRKMEILKQSNLLESLGVPIKRSSNTSETFSVPIKKKQILIQKPTTLDKPYTPEPELNKQVYWQILEACQSLGVEMERHPSTYKDKGEEALRDLLLMLLGLNFDSVTGETFNKKGKTDILIKHEGKNIFVAECKFWRGEKLHHETIDQILSYLTWRDSKAAIIYFVDNKNLQPVLDTIESKTPTHSCHVKMQQKGGESWFNYHFHLLDDDTRGVELAIMVFYLNS